MADAFARLRGRGGASRSAVVALRAVSLSASPTRPAGGATGALRRDRRGVAAVTLSPELPRRRERARAFRSAAIVLLTPSTAASSTRPAAATVRARPLGLRTGAAVPLRSDASSRPRRDV
ncbi:MAG: hypothetical protein IT382_03435 [Deltaproteobacteria bacterium]|nr:hypothetical protein [Deltaproteobacteria bacterium]